MRSSSVPLAFALIALALPLTAQQVTIAAAVPVTAPIGAGMRNLTFGVIVPVSGVTQAVDVIAAADPVTATVQSGEFRYDMGGVRGVDFHVTMPTQLTAAAAVPLALTSNGAQYGGYCVSTTATCALTGFNPAAATNVRVCRVMLSAQCNPSARGYAAGNIMRVYVGGRLTVPPAARAGVYNGTVTLTIVQVY